MSKFLHTNNNDDAVDDNNDAKAVVIPLVFSEKSRGSNHRKCS